ncbi:unnamed protein product [Cochlearia groenlandica]
MALELNFLLSWIFLCIAATISSTLFFYRKKPNQFTTSKQNPHHKKQNKNLPPGELGLPWIDVLDENWRVAVRGEIDALEENGTWTVEKLLPGNKALRYDYGSVFLGSGGVS